MKPGIELEGKRVLVVGLARTGIAVAGFCAERGARVAVTEQAPESRMPEAAARLRAAGFELEFGGHSPAILRNRDLVIVSPGVPANQPLLEQARAQGIPVWGEIELAWRFLRGRLVAVTGSNGKTTTTSLIGHILGTAAFPTLVGGNIGTPLISLVAASSDSSVTVAEVSSFQMETIEAFRPDVSVMLNLTPDHLDRHSSFDDYARAKLRIFRNQREQDSAVLNADDAQVSERAPQGPRLYWFSRQRVVTAGAYVRDGQVVFRHDGQETLILRREEIPLRGEHNLENVLAACAAAILVGALPSAIAKAVRSFAGVEHRLEFVAEVGGVNYYNDSKATNVDATLKALDAFQSPLFVILGGKDKGGDFAVLREPLRRNTRCVLLIGAAAEKIAGQLGDVVPIEQAGTLDRALAIASERARPGDSVLLAPACASFDQFENFEHRGRVFKQLVERLSRNPSGGQLVGRS